MPTGGNNAAVSSEEAVPHIVIDTATHPVEFFGRQIAFYSTDKGGSLRWTELAIYRIASDKPEWVTVSAGKSVVYHKADSSCNAAIQDSAELMELGLRPCPRCKPENYLQATEGTLFKVEVDFPRHRICRSADEIIEALSENGDRRVRNGELSQPSVIVLEIARRSDPDLARQLAEIRPLY